MKRLGLVQFGLNRKPCGTGALAGGSFLKTATTAGDSTQQAESGLAGDPGYGTRVLRANSVGLLLS